VAAGKSELSSRSSCRSWRRESASSRPAHGPVVSSDSRGCATRAAPAGAAANTAAARYTVLFEDGDECDLSLDELKCAERMSLPECC
jgi:hypothetical protein